MSETTDLEPQLSSTSSSIEYSPTEYRSQIKELETKLSHLEAQHAKALKQTKDSDINAFNCFKADVIVCLKAIELAAIASQRHGEIALNHHVRDMRLEHLQGIIKNQLADFSDRRLVHYEDDF